MPPCCKKLAEVLLIVCLYAVLFFKKKNNWRHHNVTLQVLALMENVNKSRHVDHPEAKWETPTPMMALLYSAFLGDDVVNGQTAIVLHSLPEG